MHICMPLIKQLKSALQCILKMYEFQSEFGVKVPIQALLGEVCGG